MYLMKWFASLYYEYIIFQGLLLYYLLLSFCGVIVVKYKYCVSFIKAKEMCWTVLRATSRPQTEPGKVLKHSLTR